MFCYFILKRWQSGSSRIFLSVWFLSALWPVSRTWSIFRNLMILLLLLLLFSSLVLLFLCCYNVCVRVCVSARACTCVCVCVPCQCVRACARVRAHACVRTVVSVIIRHFDNSHNNNSNFCPFPLPLSSVMSVDTMNDVIVFLKCVTLQASTTDWPRPLASLQQLAGSQPVPAPLPAVGRRKTDS